MGQRKGNTTVTSNINTGHANGRRRGKKGRNVETKPETQPVIRGFVHPDAIAEAKRLRDEERPDTHLVYDIVESCMWVKNGAK
jgi:hypothetical protein